LLTPNSRPHYLRPIEYWNLQEAFIRLREKYPDLYWPLYFDWNAALNPTEPQCDPQPPDAAVQRPAGGTALPAKSAYDPTVYAPENLLPPTRTAPAREQSNPSSASSNYDPEYYSPQRIAERAAAKKPPDS
jgi:hypothetical protein